MTVEESPAGIHRFWFGASARELDDAAIAQRQSKLWWAKDDGTDREIAERFVPWITRAERGELAAWADTSAGLLALVLLTDQFPRNAFRGTPQAFAFDTLARGWCRTLIDGPHYETLRPIERVFALLPLEHSESLADQDACVARMQALHAQAAPAFLETAAGYVDYAIRHRDIVARFGRFPHRNTILGRPSTPEEVAFLATPGSSF